jgi:hypothetical protein
MVWWSVPSRCSPKNVSEAWAQRWTAAAALVTPDVPATLVASDLGLSVYRQLGFLELHRPVALDATPTDCLTLASRFHHG